jgi:nucleosome binding factor SPN SPT16 subunit
MEILPIKDMLQYDSYCAEVGRLIELDPAPDSEDGRRLAELVIVIEEFESRRGL